MPVRPHYARNVANLFRPRRRRDVLLLPILFAAACLPDPVAGFIRRHLAPRWYGIRYERCARCLLDPYHA